MYKKILLKNGFQEGNKPKSQQKVTYKKNFERRNKLLFVIIWILSKCEIYINLFWLCADVIDTEFKNMPCIRIGLYGLENVFQKYLRMSLRMFGKQVTSMIIQGCTERYKSLKV